MITDRLAKHLLLFNNLPNTDLLNLFIEIETEISLLADRSEKRGYSDGFAQGYASGLLEGYDQCITDFNDVKK